MNIVYFVFRQPVRCESNAILQNLEYNTYIWKRIPYKLKRKVYYNMYGSELVDLISVLKRSFSAGFSMSISIVFIIFIRDLGVNPVEFLACWTITGSLDTGVIP
uniref:Uncharacterized protein n=1 Tax=Glossina austeni TaxID=7395 RepID=A0A1A9UXY3_GLOAU